MDSDSGEPQNAGQTELTRPEQSWIRQHWPELAFFTGLTGMSMLVGFGTTLAAAKKSDPTYFGRGMTPGSLSEAKHAAELHESGSLLALRALRRATLYSVGGFTLFCFTVWKLSGASNFAEFRLKMGHILPSVRKNDPPTSRVDFENLSEFFQYISDEDKRKKNLAEDLVQNNQQNT